MSGERVIAAPAQAIFDGETFDYSQMTVPLAPLFLEVAGFPRRNKVGIQRTLDRLTDQVLAGRPREPR